MHKHGSKSAAWRQTFHRNSLRRSWSSPQKAYDCALARISSRCVLCESASKEKRELLPLAHHEPEIVVTASRHTASRTLRQRKHFAILFPDFRWLYVTGSTLLFYFQIFADFTSQDALCYFIYRSSWLANRLVAECEGLTLWKSKPAFEHDPVPVASTSHPHNLFP
jgi:hypothetical protein